MFAQLILIVPIIILITACTPDISAAAPPALPTQNVATPTPQRDCDLNAVMSWEMVFQPTLTDDVEAAQRQRDTYAARPFPPCAAEARDHALAAYDAVIRAAQARASGDDDAYAEAIAEHSAAQQRYFAAVSQLNPTQSPIPTVVEPVLVDCPSLTATCSELTCAQAYACLGAGNDSLDQNKDTVPCENVCR
ncbi:MAG: hypothetical protein MUF38_10415 [Anaerolineae bacterium]|jgi:hypothetical protein|nr:hypothetical protein [Anaerolineae bacterium]